ncbi:MAG: hypothetical protein V4581_02920 [Bacteroidota bacterium]
MKYILFIAALFSFNGLFAQNDTIKVKEHYQKAVMLAVDWTEQLMSGENVEKIVAYTALPFVKDGDEILITKKEVTDFYKEVILDKGKRKVPQMEARILSERKEILDQCIPVVYTVVAVDVEFKGEKERIVISVLYTNGEYKVAGFKD